MRGESKDFSPLDKGSSEDIMISDFSISPTKRRRTRKSRTSDIFS